MVCGFGNVEMGHHSHLIMCGFGNSKWDITLILIAFVFDLSKVITLILIMYAFGNSEMGPHCHFEDVCVGLHIWNGAQSHCEP